MEEAKDREYKHAETTERGEPGRVLEGSRNRGEPATPTRQVVQAGIRTRPHKTEGPEKPKITKSPKARTAVWTESTEIGVRVVDTKGSK